MVRVVALPRTQTSQAFNENTKEPINFHSTFDAFNIFLYGCNRKFHPLGAFKFIFLILIRRGGEISAKLNFSELEQKPKNFQNVKDTMKIWN